MDIFLSVNNRAEILKIPVLPPSFAISKPQGLTTFETASKGDLQLIGEPGLKGITIESFFPIRDYPFLRDSSMKGWEYVYQIDTWILNKLPIRLIITDTPINMVVAVKNFSYEVKTDGDLWYSLELEQMPLLGYENPGNVEEEEIDMAKLEELEKRLKAAEDLLNQLANPFIYNYIDDNMPEWARASVQKAVDKGILQGIGTDVNGTAMLDLTRNDLRTFLYHDRLGHLD